MPGVLTIPQTAGRRRGLLTPAHAQVFAAGVCQKGPHDRAVEVTSLDQFETNFGPLQAFSAFHTQIQAYFEESKGGKAIIGRTLGATPVLATVNLDTGKFVVTAKEFGAFANAWKASYATASKTLTIDYGAGVTKDYPGTSAAEILAAVAADTTARVTVTGSGTLPSGNVTATNLAGGTDDHANITTTQVGNALALFTSNLGRGAVIVPEWSAADIGEILIAHASQYGRVAIMSTDRADDLAAAGTIGDGLRADDTDGSGGLFWPWVTTPLGSTIGPEGAIAGRRAKMIREKGAWFPPAGGNGKFEWVTGVDQTITPEALDTAHDDHAVNAIKIDDGKPVLYGWRTLSLEEGTFRYLSIRDTVNHTRTLVESAEKKWVMQPMTDAMPEDAAGDVIGVLKTLATAGAFSPLRENGVEIDPGWIVETTFDVDPVTGKGTVTPATQIRPVGAAETIIVPTTVVPYGTGF